MTARRMLHYEILRKLGAGGMGEVWLARDSKLERDVAIKVLSPDFISDPDRLERFRREARAVAALSHPNIITIHSVEEADGTPFFTMEYVDGTTLTKIIPEAGLDPKPFLDLAIQIADAVSAAHEHGITHRDLKPGNIMISSRGQLKVLDFGLAKVSRTTPADGDSDSHLETELLTSDGKILGTTPYMSPEQLKGKPVDQRSDIFSLGTILYVMATGSHPFRADSSAEMISSILHHHPPEVGTVRGGLPEYLSGIIGRCLAKDPEERYQSAGELRNDLENLREKLRGGVASTLVMSSGEKRSRRRFEMSLRALVLAAVAVVVLIGTVLMLGTRSPPLPPLQATAVLPFANLTGDPELDHLAAGLTAGLVNRLREEPGLQVTSRPGFANAADGRRSRPPEGVGSLVDGDVLKEGTRLASTLRLTDAATGVVLWSHTYSAPGGELYGQERVMAGDLANFLSIPLSPGDRRRLASGPVEADQALDYYVTGCRFLDRVDDLRGPDAAADNFRQALRLDPDFALAHVSLSEALVEIYLRDFDAADLDAAESHAERARSIAPEMPEARLALAQVYRLTGRQDAAVAEVEAALAEHPRADLVQLELGRTYERLGDLDAAERSFRAAASLRPGDWGNWNALGNFYARNGKYDEARDAYAEAAEVAPSDVSMPREKLATYNLQVGEVDLAIDIYESLPKPIRSPRLASNLATAYFFSDRPDRWQRAEENYLLAVRLSPQDPMYLMNLGDLYFRLERYGEAKDCYRRASELREAPFAEDPENPTLMSEVAFTSAKAGNCERALELAPQLERLLPDTGPSAHQLAYVYGLCGEGDAAVAALRRAIAHGESVALIRQEDEFRSLRDRPDFQALVGEGGAG